jgi:uncharacterized protein YifE (UPF0438 family)
MRKEKIKVWKKFARFFKKRKKMFELAQNPKKTKAKKIKDFIN